MNGGTRKRTSEQFEALVATLEQTLTTEVEHSLALFEIAHRDAPASRAAPAAPASPRQFLSAGPFEAPMTSGAASPSLSAAADCLTSRACGGPTAGPLAGYAGDGYAGGGYAGDASPMGGPMPARKHPFAEQFVTKGQFVAHTREAARQFGTLFYELRRARVEYEAYENAGLANRISDLERREKLRQELQELQAQRRRTLHELVTALREKDGIDPGAAVVPQSTAAFRAAIESLPYGRAEEKEQALALLDDQLRWLGGRKKEFIDEMLADVESTLTQEFLKHPVLVARYKQSLPMLIADVTPCTPMSSADCSETETEDEAVADAVARRPEKVVSDDDYGCAEADDSMVM